MFELDKNGRISIVGHNLNKPLMYDLRKIKIIKLDNSQILKDKVAYKFEDESTGKELIAKMINGYKDSDDFILTSEFRKMVLLSDQPEIGSVFFLATSELKGYKRSCYIMEFVHGKTLDDFLKREFLIYEVLFDLIIQLSSALEKAHNFEIYHNDLHNQNIIINNDGYLKVIDFSWFDYKKPKLELRDNDLLNFKRIVSEFEQKCKNEDKNRFKLISKYCESITSFKGLKKEFELLNEVSFELSMIDDKSLNLLSKLFELTEDVYDLKIYFKEYDYIIPDRLISPLEDDEKKLLKKINSNNTSIQYSDTRVDRISRDMKNIFNEKFHILKQIYLIDWNLKISSSGEIFEGPYNLYYQVWFTSKFFKWKKTHELIPLTAPVSETFEELLDI